MNVGLPTWLELRRGDTPVVIVAPHGGRRQREIRRGDSINDLYTAELAAELAERTGAFALINHGLDRNEVDLNRISELTAAAPQVLIHLRSLVELAGAAGQCAPLVLFIHGWNVAMPWCDIGVGVRERGGVLSGRYPTASQAAFDGFVGGLRELLEACRIGASVGHRYPASGNDNATQLFSGRHSCHEQGDVASLSELAAAGRADAVQIELGIPLRWPGEHRRRLVDALASAVAHEVERRRRSHGAIERSVDWSLPAKGEPSEPHSREAGYSLQAALDDGSGLFLGAEPTASGSMAARMCVASRGGRMFLFVGEGPCSGRADDYEVAGLKWHIDPQSHSGDGASIRVDFNGVLVAYADHDAFVDLETGLAGSELIEARVRLVYTGGLEGFGRLRGSIVLSGVDVEVDVVAVAARGRRSTANVSAHGRVYLTTGMGCPRVVACAASDVGEASAARRESVSFGAGADGQMSSVALSSGDGVSVPGEICVRVPVYRVVGNGEVVRVTFGVVRFVGRGAATEEAGVFELIERIADCDENGSPTRSC